jgi:hypothetical protein
MHDDHLGAIEICKYHSIKVDVDNLAGEVQTQICRCTGNQLWRGGNKRNDWVWV